MRHGDKVNALGRTKSHRDAMIKNMASSLIEHKRITTTLAKAKVLRGFLEPLVTKSKNNNTHSRRVVFSYLQNKSAVDTLFTDIREKVVNRPGGYLRIIKLGVRKHDNTEMALIEFVDFNTLYNPNQSLDGKAKTKTRRSRKKTSGSATQAAPAAEVAETAEAPAEEIVEAPVEAVETVSVDETPAPEVVEEAQVAEAVEEAAASEETPASEETSAEEDNKEA